MEKLQGSVVWYSPTKGYGFIEDSEGKSSFVHHSAILMDGFRKLNTGQVVTYELGEDMHGRVCAVNVFVVDEGGAE